VAPVVAVPILSFGYSMMVLALTSATQPGIVVGDPATLFIPGAIYDAVLAIFIGPLVVTLHERYATAERVDW
jgi:hypothetical protein